MMFLLGFALVLLGGAIFTLIDEPLLYDGGDEDESL